MKSRPLYRFTLPKVYRRLPKVASRPTQPSIKPVKTITAPFKIFFPETENNIIFLPQLIQAAETSKMAFSVIKKTFKETSATKGPIIMATVHGDIHDIGKNIVKVVLESYGYKIIDLGKDVPPETIVEAYHKHQPKAIGLSALMTTTVVSMEKTIALLKEVDNMCPIFVGGAVLTADFAKEINADFYVKDAMDTVELMNKIVK